MRLRSFGSLQKILVLLALVGLPWTVFVDVSFGQERKIDSMFLDLDKNIVFRKNGLRCHLNSKILIRELKTGHRWRTLSIRLMWSGFHDGLPIQKR